MEKIMIHKYINESLKYFLLIIAFYALASVQIKGQNLDLKVIYSGPEKLIIGTNSKQLSTSGKNNFDEQLLKSIKNSSDYLIDSLGRPKIPILKTLISIPNGKNVNTEIIPGTPVVFDNIILQPAQAPEVDCPCDTIKYYFDSICFSSNKFYPGKMAECSPVRNKRGYKIADLYFYPYQYNPVKKQLFVYPDLTITIEFKGAKNAISGSLKSNYVENLIKSRCINGKEVLENEQFSNEILPENTNSDTEISSIAVNKTVTAKQTSTTTGCEYLIITHPNFLTAANTLKSWKEDSLGIKTIVVTTTEISATYNSDNDAARRTAIENFINNAYNTWLPRPEYLLFVGDIEFIPTFVIPDGQTNYATDLYYADIDNPADIEADIPGYGRISVDNQTEADLAVSKIIDYESTYKGAAFYNSVLLSSFFQDYNLNGVNENGYVETMEDIRNFMVNGLTLNAKYVYYADNNVNPQSWGYDCSDPEREPNEWCSEVEPEDLVWDGDYLDITAAINEGCFLFLHRDHGVYNAMYHPYFDISHVQNLSNGSLRPIVWSINCLTGIFDTTGGECFAEHWLIHPTGGGAGIVAATRTTVSPENNKMIKGMVDAIWPQFNYGSSHTPIYRMGDILDYGKSFNFSFSSGNKSLYHYFGDPTMRIYPYGCLRGNIIFANETIYTNKQIKACKDISITNVTVNNSINLEIYFGNSLEINGEFEAQTGSVLLLQPENIETGFVLP